MLTTPSLACYLSHLRGGIVLKFIGLFLLLAASHAAFSDQITLYIIKPPLPLDWTTPGSLVRTSVRNYAVLERQGVSIALAGHAVGHMDVELNCSGFEVQYSAPTSSDAVDLLQLVKGSGFEYVMHAVKGRFYTQEEILGHIAHYEQDGRMNSITFQISPSTCARLRTYHDQYVASGYDQWLGGALDRPRYGESAGCTAYGMSYLELSGLINDEMRAHWMRTLSMPDDLIGQPGHPAKYGFASYLLGVNAHWAAPGEPSETGGFWDPEFIFNWISEVSEHPEDAPPGLVQVSQTGTMHNLTFDATNVPTPTDPIWLMTTNSNSVEAHR